MRRHSPRLRDLALTAVMAVSLTVVPPPRPVAAGTAASMYGSCGTDFSETVTDGTATFYWRLLGGRGAYGSVYLAPAGTFAWTDVWNAYMTPGVWTTVSFSVAGYRDGYYDIGLHAPGYNDHCISRAVYVRNVPTAPYPVTVSPSSSTTDTFTFSWGASHDSFGIAYYEYGWASIYPRGTTTATSVTLSGGDPGPGTYTFCARAVNTQGDRSAWGCASYIYSSYRTVFTAFSWSGPIVAGCPATATATLAYVDASGREVPLAGESVVFAFELPFGSPGVPGLRLGQGWTDGTGTATVSGLVPSAGAGFFSLGPSTVYALFGGDRAYRYARASATVLILPDSSPPTVPDVTSVPVASTTNDFTASWPASVSACGVRSYRYRIDGGAISSVSGTSVSGPLAPSQGTHEIEVAAADRDGLISAWSAPASFTYALPPSVPLVTVAPAVSATNSFAASWSASTSALGVSYYRYRVDGGPASSTTSTSVTGPLAPSLGTHEIEVSAVDSAGNVSAWSVPTSFTYTSPPSVPVVTVTPATSTTDSFTASWPASTSSVGVAYYRYQIDGGPVSITTKASVAGPLAPTYGTHTIRVLAVDGAGDASAWSAPASFEWRRATTDTVFTSLPTSVARCTSIDLSAELTSEGTPLAGTTLSFAVGTSAATATTSASGVASVAIPFDGAPGSYTATATYAGDATLPGSTATATIDVTGDASASCTPTGGGGSGGSGGASGSGGSGGSGGAPAGSGSGGGGRSVDIPTR